MKNSACLPSKQALGATCPGNGETIEEANENEDGDGTPLSTTVKRRERHSIYNFDCRHPLYQTHVQRLRAKQLTTIKAGARPPKYPGRRKKGRSTHWTAVAHSFAEYVLVLYKPWNYDDLVLNRLRLSWRALGDWIHHDLDPPYPDYLTRYRKETTFSTIPDNGTTMQTSETRISDVARVLRNKPPNGESPKELPQNATPIIATPYIQRARMQQIDHLAFGLHAPWSLRDTFNTYRRRHCGGIQVMPGQQAPVDKDVLNPQWETGDDGLAATDLEIVDLLDIAAGEQNPANSKARLFVQASIDSLQGLKTHFNALIAGRHRGNDTRDYRGDDEIRITTDTDIRVEQSLFGQGALPYAPPTDGSPTTGHTNSEYIRCPVHDLNSTLVLRRYILKMEEMRRTGTVGNADMPTGLSKLNKDQESALHIMENYFLETIYSSNNTTAPPKAPLIFVHGGPGVGKTYFTHYVLARALHHGLPIACCAAQGSAASLLPIGRTVHALFGIHPTKPFERIAKDTARHAALVEALLHVKLLVIDEFSLVTVEMLGWINVRLMDIMDSEVPFGGLAIMALGDMAQMKSPAGDSIHSDLIRSLQPIPPVLQNVHKATGIYLFKQFRLLHLLEQMRAAECNIQADFVVQLRDYTKPFPFTRQMLESLVQLSAQDIADDPTWAFAPILVTNNMQRFALNTESIKSFAEYYGKPILRWKKVPLRTNLDSYSARLVDYLYDTEPGLWQSFVVGAPVAITSNLNAPRGFANGTAGTLASVIFPPAASLAPGQEDDDDGSLSRAARIAEIIETYQTAGPGIVITIPDDCQPIYVAVTVPHLKPENASDWPATQTLKEGHVTVPVPVEKRSMREFRLPSRKGERAHTLTLKTHAYELSFAITYNKSQGHTLDKVVLDLNYTRPAPTIDMLNVGMTRVRRFKNMRIMPPHDTALPGNSAFNHLLKLQRDELFGIWITSYDKDTGFWKDDICKELLAATPTSPEKERFTRTTAPGNEKGKGKKPKHHAGSS